MKSIFKKALFLAIGFATFANLSQGQDVTDSTKVTRKKLYFGAGMDMMSFSTASYGTPTTAAYLTTLRFQSYVFNLGVNINFDFSNNVGVFSGVNFKNIGFIEKYAFVDSTVKRRVLTLGIPLGIKAGNIGRHFYGFAGGGVDFPLNYKEKGFIRRGKKDKFNEWFSDRTPQVMPYVFAGICLKPGVTIKFQYYTTNFLNTGFTTQATVPGTQTTFYTNPYASYTKLNLMLLSIGFDMRYTKKSKKEPASSEPEMNTM